jgi:hypothetical protein
VEERRRRAEQRLEMGMIRGNPVVLKEEPPFRDGEDGYRTLMDPRTRVVWCEETGSYKFP